MSTVLKFTEYPLPQIIHHCHQMYRVMCSFSRSLEAAMFSLLLWWTYPNMFNCVSALSVSTVVITYVPLTEFILKGTFSIDPLPAAFTLCFCSARRENFPWMINCMLMYALSWVAFIVHSQFCVCISQCLYRCYSSVFLNVRFYTYYSESHSPVYFV